MGIRIMRHRETKENLINEEEIINNEALKTRAMVKLFGRRKNYNFKLKNLKLNTNEGDRSYGVEENKTIT